MDRNEHLKSRITRKKKPDSIIKRKTGSKNGEHHYDGFNMFLSSIGNQGIQRLFGAGKEAGVPSKAIDGISMIQAKMDISQPGDFYEQQANQVARKILNNTSEPTGNAVKIDTIQTKGSSGSSVSGKIEVKIKNLKGGGTPLSKSARSFFEPHFGVDLGHVRIHNSDSANKLATSLNARAFTHNSDIVFNRGEKRLPCKIYSSVIKIRIHLINELPWKILLELLTWILRHIKIMWYMVSIYSMPRRKVKAMVGFLLLSPVI